MASESSAAGESVLKSPYYFHASDNTGQAQTPILFDGNNYDRWSKLMLNSLRTKRKVGFLDGSLKRPSNNSDEAEKWDMVNSMIIGWIYSSIEPRLRPSVSLVDSVKLMWDVLQRRFSVNDGTKDHQLRSDLAACRQDGDSVEAYFGKLKVLWDDLADLEAGFKCCCGDGGCDSMVKYQAHCEKIRVHQFLMGLDGVRFGTTRSNLLSRESELNLDNVYSRIVQEERHLNATRAPPAAVGFSANVSGSATSTRPNNKGSKCNHCGKMGHDVSTCFQIHGFPEWWTEKSQGRGRGIDSANRGKGRGSTARVNLTQTADAVAAPGIPNFTPEQWASLANFMSSQKSEKPSGKKDKLLLFGLNRRFDVIIDSGASHHMTGDASLLSHVAAIDPCPIRLPNGEISWATSHGTLEVGCSHDSLFPKSYR